MSAWRLAAFTVSFMTMSSATACLYNPVGPLRPGRNDSICHHPIDDASRTFSPWDHSPRCLRTGPGQNETVANITQGVYCLYTSSASHSGHGISIVTTPELASSLVASSILSEPPVSPVFQPLPKPDAYRIVDIAGKARGMIATRKLKRGEIFMVEYPTLLLGVSFLRDSKAHHRRRLVKRAVEQLPEETRRGVYELHRKKGNYVLDDILAPNAVSVQVTEEEGFMGLFLKFSRINHDCQPNALYRFSPKTLALEVFPYRTIQPGEEITVSYTPISMPRHQRHEYLRQVWGFDCSCSLCRSTDEAEISDSDHRRERVGELRESVMQASSKQYFENALVMAHEWLGLGEKEGIPPLLAEYYDIVARLSFDVGDLQDARRYALLALDAWTKFGSVDDTDLEAAREYVRELNRLRRDVKLERKGVANMFKDS